MSNEMEYGGFVKRFGAYLIDSLLCAIPVGIVGFVLNVITGNMRMSSIIGIICQFALLAIFEGGEQKASLGKRALKLYVVKKDGMEATLSDIMVRNAIKLFPMLIIAAALPYTGDLEYISGGAAVVLTAGYILELIDMISIFFRTHRTLHDIMAGTAVICDMAEMSSDIDGSDPENGQQSEALETEKTATPAGNYYEEERTTAPEFAKAVSAPCKIKGVDGLYAEAIFSLEDTIVMGRARQGCNIHFPENMQGVSRLHLSVSQEGDKVRIKDLGSSYGVEINDSLHMNQGDTRLLNKGDTFRIGKAQVFMVI